MGAPIGHRAARRRVAVTDDESTAAQECEGERGDGLSGWTVEPVSGEARRDRSRAERLVDVDDRAARVAVHVGWPRDAALSATPATKRQCQVPVGDAADAVLEEASRENDGGAVRDVQRPGVG